MKGRKVLQCLMAHVTGMNQQPVTCQGAGAILSKGFAKTEVKDSGRCRG